MVLVKTRRATELPPAVAASLGALLPLPEDAFVAALGSFTLPPSDGKPDLLHWLPLLNRLDALLEHVCAAAPECSLAPPAPASQPLPRAVLLAVLRLTTALVENSHNRQLYGSAEARRPKQLAAHLMALLSASDGEVVDAALGALAALARRSLSRGTRWHESFEGLRPRLAPLLLQLARARAGLSLLVCASGGVLSHEQLVAARAVRFEFYAQPEPGAAAPAGLRVICFPDATAQAGCDATLTASLADAAGVPSGQGARFPLLAAIRAARASASEEGRAALARRRLAALHALLQVGPESDMLQQLQTSDASLVSDLCSIAALPAASGACPPWDASDAAATPIAAQAPLRRASLRCLAALIRARVSAVPSTLASGSHCRLLPDALHSAVASLLADAALQGALLPDAAADGIGALAPGTATVVGANVGAPRSATDMEATTGEGAACDLGFAEAVLSLVATLASGVPECGLSENSAVACLTPLLRDTATNHAALLAVALRLLEAFMEFGASTASRFRDAGGMQLLLRRLQVEVDPDGVWGVGCGPLPPVPEAEGPSVPAPAGDAGEMPDAPPLPAAPVQPVSSEPGAPAPPQLAAPPVEAPDATPASHASRSLVKSLLRCIAHAAFAGRSGGGGGVGAATALAAASSSDGALPRVLVALYRRPRAFGGSAFALAANLLTDTLHMAPAAWAVLDTYGAPGALLSSLAAGIPPSGDAAAAVPAALAAICLAPAGLQAVLAGGSLGGLQPLLPMLAGKAHVRALAGSDSAGAMAGALDELLRHVPQLRSAGTALLMAAIEQMSVEAGCPATAGLSPSVAAVPSAGGAGEGVTATSAGGDASMDTGEPQLPAVVLPAEIWVGEAIGNLARVVETVSGSGESCRALVAAGAVPALLRLLAAPRMRTPAWHAAPAAAQLASACRSFDTSHAPAVADALRSALEVSLAELAACARCADAGDGDPAPPATLKDAYSGALLVCEALLGIASHALRAAPSAIVPVLAVPSLMEALGAAERRAGWLAALAEEARAASVDGRIDLPQLEVMAAEMAADVAGALPAAVDVSKLQEALAAGLSVLSDGRAAAAAAANAAANAAAAASDAAAFASAIAPPDPDTLAAAAASVFAAALLPGDDSTTAAAVAAAQRETPQSPLTQPALVPEQLAAARAELARRLTPLMCRTAKAAAAATAAAEEAAAFARFDGAVRIFYSGLAKAAAYAGRRSAREPAAVSQSSARLAAALLARNVVTALLPPVELRGGAPIPTSAVRLLPGLSACLPMPEGASSSASARFLFRSLDETGALLFDPRRRSGNALLLNYVYALGGASAVSAAVSTLVSEFFATAGLSAGSQPTVADLAAARARAPAWLHDALCCAGVLVEVLCNAALVLGSGTLGPSHFPPGAANAGNAELLAAPLPPDILPPPSLTPVPERGADADGVLHGLRFSALSSVLELWRDVRAGAGPPRFVQALLVALAHAGRAAADAEAQSALARVSQERLAAANERPRGQRAPEAAPPGAPAPSPELVAAMVDMGFPAERVLEALRHVRHQTVDHAMEWLISHPEEAEAGPAAPAAPLPPAEEDADLAEALAMSMRPDGADGPATAAAPPAQQEQMSDAAPSPPEVPPLAVLLPRSLALVVASPAAAWAATELLGGVARRGGSAAFVELAGMLATHLRSLSAEVAASSDPALASASEEAAATTHCIALLVAEEAALRPELVKAGLPDVLLAMLERAMSDHTSSTAPPLPPWAAASLLVLEALAVWRAPDADGPAGDEAPATGEAAAPASDSPAAPGAEASVLPRSLGFQLGHLTADEHGRAVTASVALLKAAAVAGISEAAPVRATAAAVAHASLALACRLTRRYPAAVAWHNAGGTAALLSLPPGALFPALETLASTVLRHALEDSNVLRTTMEAEIRATLTSRGGSCSSRTLFAQLAAVSARDPDLFADAVAAVAVLQDGPRSILALAPVEPVKPGEAPQRKPKPVPPPVFLAVLDALATNVTSFVSDAAAPAAPGSGLVAGHAALALRLLTEFVLMYSPVAPALLRRDADSSAGAPKPLLAHVLGNLLPARAAASGDGGDAARVSDRAAIFLLALCVRSPEGRRRVLAVVAGALASSRHGPPGQAAPPAARAFVGLVNSLLASRDQALPGAAGATGTDGRRTGIGADVSRAMRECGMAQALAASLRSIDLEHPDAAAAVNGVLRPLETLTRSYPTTAVHARPLVAAEVLAAGGAAQLLSPRLTQVRSRGDEATPARRAAGGGTFLSPTMLPPPVPAAAAGGQPTPGAAGPPPVVDTPATVAPPLNEQVAAVEEMAAQLFRGGDRRRRPSAIEFAIDGDDGEREDASMGTASMSSEGDMSGGDADMLSDSGEEGGSDGEGGSEESSGEPDPHDEESSGMEMEAEALELEAEAESESEGSSGDEGVGVEEVLADGWEAAEDWEGDADEEDHPEEGDPEAEASGSESDAEEEEQFGHEGPLEGGWGMEDEDGEDEPELRDGIEAATGLMAAEAVELRWRDGSGRRGALNLPPGLRLPPGGAHSLGELREALAVGGAGNPGGEQGFLADVINEIMDTARASTRRLHRRFTDLVASHGGGRGPLDRDALLAGMLAPGGNLIDPTAPPPQQGARHPLLQRAIPSPSPRRPPPPPPVAATLPAVLTALVADVARLAVSPELDASEVLGAGGAGAAAAESGDAVRQQLPSLYLPTSREAAGDAAVQASTALLFGGASLSEGAQMSGGAPGSHDPRRAAWGDDGGSGSGSLVPLALLEQETLRRLRLLQPPAPPPPAELQADAADAAAAEAPEPDSPEAPPGVVEDMDAVPQLRDDGASGSGSESAGVESDDEDEDEEAAPPPDTAAAPEGDGAPAGEAEPAPEIADIDASFLEALPDELRAEVMAQQVAAAAQRAAAARRRTSAAIPSSPAADAGPAGAAADAGPGIDPDFLAALPPDIAAEVMAQQRAAERAAAAREARARATAAAAEAGEGGAAEEDAEDGGGFAAALASFPPDVRAEVLMTADDAMLAQLPPALAAEAMHLRSRAARRFTVAGGPAAGLLFPPPPRRMGEALARTLQGQPGVREAPRALATTHPKDVDGDSALDAATIEALVRLLRLASPLSRGLLPRLLLNLCAHAGARRGVLRCLCALLRPEPADPPPRALHGAAAVGMTEGGDSHAVPPLVLRRALETTAFLARHHVRCALTLPVLPVPPPPGSAPARAAAAQAAKGKARAGEIGADAAVDAAAHAAFAASMAAVLAAPPGALPPVVVAGGPTELVPPRFGEERALVLVLRLLSPAPADEPVTDAALQLLEYVLKAAAQPEKPAAEGAPPAAAQADEPPVAPPPLSAPPPEAAAEVQPSTGAEAMAEDAPAAPSEAVKAAAEAAGAAAEEALRRQAAVAEIAALPEAALRCLPSLLAAPLASTHLHDRVTAVITALARVHVAAAGPLLAALAEAMSLLAAPASSALSQLAEAGVDVGGALPAATTPLLLAGPALRRLMKAAVLLVDHEPSGGAAEAPEARGAALEGVARAVSGIWGALLAVAGALEDALAAGDSPGGPAAPLPAAASAALPLLEAWFALADGAESGAARLAAESAAPPPLLAAASQSVSASQPASPAREGGLMRADSASVLLTSFAAGSPAAAMLATFVERHRRLVNAAVRAQPALLEASLRRLLRCPRLLDFDNKRAMLRSRLRAAAAQDRTPGLRVVVRRPHVLTDSYQQLHLRSGAELRGRLSVQFQGEEGVDAGGLTREWYSILARAMFDPSFALFVPAASSSAVFQPNKDSAVNPEHLSYFTFCGRIVGKALRDGALLDAYFTRSFYKHILGQGCTYEDIEATDPDYYAALKWMLENDISGVLDLTFVAEEDYFGAKSVVELKEGGANIPVTEENKREYVHLVTAHRMTGAIRAQTDAFTRGFHDLVPREFVAPFNAAELELLVSGLPEIDVDDLQAHTEYSGFTPASPTIVWFWAVIRSLTAEDLARFVMFVTGSSKVPLGGFATLQGVQGPQRFQIHRAYGPVERLCTAHTCFNQLDLPDSYTSMEMLRDRLLLAIREGGEGFGFA